MIKNIITSGCSFTATGGMCGFPPSELQPEGACSFNYDPEYDMIQPLNWAGIVAKSLGVKSFVNTAAPSHGNLMVFNNITYLINNFNYYPEDTLVLFNLSDPARLDIVCNWDNENRSNACDKNWHPSVMPFTYLGKQSNLSKSIVLAMGDHVEMLTSNAVLGLMSFLTNRNFDFYFTMMCDYTNHQYLGSVIEEFKDHLIFLDPGVGMYEHAKSLNLLDTDRLHPSILGQESVALQALNKIKQNERYTSWNI